jgi:hypothetical protein
MTKATRQALTGHDDPAATAAQAAGSPAQPLPRRICLAHVRTTKLKGKW